MLTALSFTTISTVSQERAFSVSCEGSVFLTYWIVLAELMWSVSNGFRHDGDALLSTENAVLQRRSVSGSSGDKYKWNRFQQCGNRRFAMA